MFFTIISTTDKDNKKENIVYRGTVTYIAYNSIAGPLTLMEFLLAIGLSVLLQYILNKMFMLHIASNIILYLLLSTFLLTPRRKLTFILASV